MKHLNKASNLDTIKKSNRSLILKLLNSTGGVSRAELAKITGLTKTSITNITSELLEERLICETGTAESSSGRKPILLEIVRDARFSIGVYISRDCIYANIANLKGEIVDEQRQPMDIMENEQSFLAGIMENIRKLLAAFPHDKSKILGIGIASIGPVDIERGIILDPPNFRGLKSIHVVEAVKETFQLATYLDHDMNSCALAEKLFGKAKSLSDFIYLGVTKGIGAGIVLNGSIYRGKDGFAGEIGHTSIDAGGKPCACGNLGCLELYADINAVLEQIRASLELGAESLLSGKSQISWSDVVTAVRAGDKISSKAIEKMAYYLSFGLVNTVNIFNPQAIFLGHEIALVEDIVLDSLREMLNRTILYKNSKNMSIEMSAFKENAPFIGAPSILLNKFFNGEL